METHPVARPPVLSADEKTLRAVEYYGRERVRGLDGGLADPHVTLAYWRLRMLLSYRIRRAFDCVTASMALVIAAPVMLLTVIAIRLDSPGPIIFRQTRVGKQGKPFTLYKFRSMSDDAEARKAELRAQNEADGPLFKMKKDPRVTRVGYVIRKLSIDELPQLFNVLQGDMSMVGPRPPVPDEVAAYQIDHLRRLEVVPGITGLAQIEGRSNLDFETWVALDRQYIAEQSLRQDLIILLKTIPAVIFGRGAY
jgi:lipopolysaccharide/colanic/teichoic acid biosynthesis glycosyltransferase